MLKTCKSTRVQRRLIVCVPWQTPIACLHTEEGRITLNGKRLRVFRDALVDEKQLGSQEEVDAALKEHFNISL